MLAERPPTSGGSDEVEWDQKEMPFTEHLRELRQRLFICVGTIFGIGDPRAVAGAAADPDHRPHVLPRASTLNAFGPADAVWAIFKFAIYIAIVIGLPVILYQIWMFVVPAIHPKTRQAVYIYVAPSIVLAAAGIAFAHFVVIKRVIGGLLVHHQHDRARPTFGIEATINLVLLLFLAFALIFQTPVIMVLLARIGLINSKMLRTNRKYIGFGMMVVGAVLAPDGSPITMIAARRRRCTCSSRARSGSSCCWKNRGSARTKQPSRASRGVGELVHEFLVLFANILFAVSLFAVWGVLTLIGVIVDQGKGADFYWQNYTPVLARIVLRLHMDNIYHSPAYIGIIGLILVSMTVATFRRVIPARLPRAAPGEDRQDPAARIGRRSKARSSDVRARVERFFAQRGWQIRKREFGGEEWSFVDKHNWARRGVLVAHVGFVIIAAGTTIYWASGYSGQFTVLSGTTGDDPANRRDRRAQTIRLPDRSGRHQERDRLPADRLRLARGRHRQRRRRARRGHSRQPALRRRRREDLSGDLRLRRSRSCSPRTAARSPGRPRRRSRKARRSTFPARRARSSTARSSARSTAAPDQAGRPTRGPTIRASCSKPSTATRPLGDVLVPLGTAARPRRRLRADARRNTPSTRASSTATIPGSRWC